MTKKKIFSGIRATGRLHLGNYLGAIKGMLELQKDPQYEMMFAVVDVHAMTTPYDKSELARSTYEIVLDYLAAGLDPTKSLVLIQSKVADLHTELAFYFSTVMTMARMQYLPTFKEKVKQHPDNVTMALLNYPLLMAADILLYKSDLIPVGVDQEPHLEITREVARKMNALYGTDFPEPKRFATTGESIPSLLGNGKMSKSIEGSYINLTDSLDMIRSKIARIPTDSGKGVKIEKGSGEENLLTFVNLFQGDKKRQEYEESYTSSGLKYKEVKEELSKAIFTELEPFQARRRELEKNPKYVHEIIEHGASEARKVGLATIKEVKTKMGLIQ